jgi:hypothetical protein
MNNSQNRNMGNRRKQGIMIPQNVNNHTKEDLLESEGNGTSVSQFKRMMTKTSQ